jgi:hypothetical protein
MLKNSPGLRSPSGRNRNANGSCSRGMSAKRRTSPLKTLPVERKPPRRPSLSRFGSLRARSPNASIELNRPQPRVQMQS